MYFGVSIFNIKLYDLVIFIFVPILFIKNTIRLTKYKYNHILIMSIYLLYLTIILVFKNNINSGVSEYFRYLIGFITIIILYYTTHSIFDMKSVVKFIPILALKNIIMGLLVWFFINYFNMNKNFISSIFNVSISNTESEFRIAGFFSDPNKYFTYFLSLLVIYEFYQYKNKKYNLKIITKENLILILGCVLSFSRTAILTVLLYLCVKIVYIKLFKYNNLLFNIFVLAVFVVIVLCFILFKDYIIDIIDYIIYSFTKLIGRESSLVYSGAIETDSRIISSKVALGSVSDSILTGGGLYMWNKVYYMPPHNTMVSVIQDTGIIGLFIFIIFMIYGLIRLPLYISITLILYPFITLDLQNYRLLYIIIGMMVLSMKNRDNAGIT